MKIKSMSSYINEMNDYKSQFSGIGWYSAKTRNVLVAYIQTLKKMRLA